MMGFQLSILLTCTQGRHGKKRPAYAECSFLPCEIYTWFMCKFRSDYIAIQSFTTVQQCNSPHSKCSCTMSTIASGPLLAGFSKALNISHRAAALFMSGSCSPRTCTPS